MCQSPAKVLSTLAAILWIMANIWHPSPIFYLGSLSANGVPLIRSLTWLSTSAPSLASAVHRHPCLEAENCLRTSHLDPMDRYGEYLTLPLLSSQGLLGFRCLPNAVVAFYHVQHRLIGSLELADWLLPLANHD